MDTEVIEKQAEATVDPVTMPREELDKLYREEPAPEPETVTEEEQPEQQAEEKHEEKPEEKAPEGEKLDQVELDAIKAENERLKSAVQNQDKLLAKLGTEVGLLRKKTVEEEQAEIAAIRDAWLDNPVEGQKMLDEYKSRKAQEETAVEQYNLLQKAQETREQTLKTIPEFESSLAEISEIIKEDGASNETVEAFKKNPYIFGREILLNLHKRNAAVKEANSHKSELERLRAEVAELKKRPDELLRKIEQASGRSTETAKSGGATGTTVTTGDKPVYAMSREDLRKIK